MRRTDPLAGERSPSRLRQSGNGRRPGNQAGARNSLWTAFGGGAGADVHHPARAVQLVLQRDPRSAAVSCPPRGAWGMLIMDQTFSIIMTGTRSWRWPDRGEQQIVLDRHHTRILCYMPRTSRSSAPPRRDTPGAPDHDHSDMPVLTPMMFRPQSQFNRRRLLDRQPDRALWKQLAHGGCLRLGTPRAYALVHALASALRVWSRPMRMAGRGPCALSFGRAARAALRLGVAAEARPHPPPRDRLGPTRTTSCHPGTATSFR